MIQHRPSANLYFIHKKAMFLFHSDVLILSMRMYVGNIVSKGQILDCSPITAQTYSPSNWHSILPTNIPSTKALMVPDNKSSWRRRTPCVSFIDSILALAFSEWSWKFMEMEPIEAQSFQSETVQIPVLQLNMQQ